MAIVLFNPTDEELRAQYGGIDVVIAALGEEGNLVRVEDQKARHILNILGPRGLTSLEFGDDSEDGAIKNQKADDGRRRALDFKKKQVRTYNRDNEGRKMRHLEYVEPPELIKKWAKDLGELLIQPYELKSVDMEEISSLRSANKELMDQLKLQQTQFSEVMAMLNQKGLLGDDKEEKEEDQHPEIKSEYIRMNRQQFEPWVRNLTFENFSLYPLPIQKDIMTKWEGFYDPEEKPFPH